MKVIKLEIEGLVVLDPRRFQDERGWFAETFSERTLREHGLPDRFVQDNQSVSHKRGTIRGLHFQIAPSAQTKLVRALSGSLIDVAVDLRPGSPTFGRWASAELSEANGHQLLVPKGFAHGFRTLVDDTAVAYKVDAFYDPQRERGIRFDDPDLAIDWGGPTDDVVLSRKDAALPSMRELGEVAF